MSAEFREVMWPIMMEMHGEEIEFVLERESIREGRTFSEKAMEEMFDQFIVFVGTRIMQRWDRTNEPPSVLSVVLKVVVS